MFLRLYLSASFILLQLKDAIEIVYYCCVTSQSYKLGLSLFFYFWFYKLFLSVPLFFLSLSSWCLSGGGADRHQQRDISSALLSLRLPLLQCDQLH